MKIVKLLKTFSKPQLDSLQHFVSSPFFKVPPDAVILLQLLLPYLQQEELTKTAIEQVKKKLVKQLPSFQETQFAKLVWKLHTVVNQFLSHSTLEKNDWYKQQLAMQACNNEATYSSYTSIASKAIKQLENTPKRDWNHHLQLFQLHHDIYFHSSTNKKDKSSIEVLEKAQNELDQFYILSKLRLGTELLFRQSVLPEKHKIPLLKEILPVAKKIDSIPISIYHNLIVLLTGKKQTRLFIQLKDDFISHLSLFQKKEKSMILQFLINYANGMYNTGDLKYLAFLFQLFQLGVKHKLFIEDQQYMAEISYSNIIITYCLNREFDAAFKVLQTHKRYLPPASRHNAFNFSMAYIHFHSMNFDKAWTLLNETAFSTIEYKIRARSLRSRCYYEQHHTDPTLLKLLENNLKNFSNFLQRSTISKRIKILYRNQIKVIGALVRFHLEPSPKKRFQKEWIDFLDQHHAMAKKWLVEKINEL